MVSVRQDVLAQVHHTVVRNMGLVVAFVMAPNSSSAASARVAVAIALQAVNT